jgi:hypothetical protein
MKTRWFFLGSILALAAVGCGGDDDDDDGAAGSGGSSGTGGSSGSSGSGGSGGSSGSGGTGGLNLTDACTNASDEAALGMTYGGAAGAAGASGGQTYSEIVGACGQMCIGEGHTGDALITCAVDCTNSATDSAVSEECTSCFIQSAECALNNCLSRCIADPSAQQCIDCRCAKEGSGNSGNVNCEAQFAACSGVERMICD